MNQPNQPQAWEKEFNERFLTKDGLISGDDIKAFISEQIAEAYERGLRDGIAYPSITLTQET